MKRWHWTVAALLIFVCTIIWLENFSAFMAQHSYYNNMLSSGSGRRMIIKGILFSAIPVLYLTYTKNITWKWVGRSVLASSILFARAHVWYKSDVIGTGGAMMIAINTAILVCLLVYVLLALLSLWTWINSITLKFKERSMTEMLLVFGIWLAAFMLVNHFLTVAQLFYPLIVRLLFASGMVLIRKQKKELTTYSQVVLAQLKTFQYKKMKGDTQTIIMFVLLILSILYLNYWLQLSFIPYPTAWDANHAYMFIPKVRANNAWVFPIGWWNVWYAFIAFRFALIKPIANFFWLSPDTIAIVMNFISGLLVMTFGLWAIVEVEKWLIKKDRPETSTDEDVPWKKDSRRLLSFWWLMLLLRLTSWMWAFLVFVDNKNDLGVMALVILAIMSWFIMFNHIKQDLKQDSKRKILQYMGVSSLFFALAICAKPSAFVDILIFLLVFVGVGFGVVFLLGAAAVALSMITKMQMGSIAQYLDASWRKNFIPWAILLVPDVAMKRKRAKQRLYYCSVRGVMVIVAIIVIKTPHIITGRLWNHEWFELKSVMTQYLMGYHESKDEKKQMDSSTLVATNSPGIPIVGGNNSVPFEQCSVEALGRWSVQDLYKDMRELWETYAEDLWRYVGFDQRKFSNPKTRSDEEKKQYGSIRIGYALLKAIFPRINYCYTTNELAKKLCVERNTLSVRDNATIEAIRDKFKTNSTAYSYLDTMIQKVDSGDLIAQNAIKEINTYRSSRVVLTDADSIAVPYRFLVPLNIVYNWSLQNLSSYYTDIWFIWVLVYCILLIWLIYALVWRKKRLIILLLATLVWWFVRVLIGSAILRYGAGLIFWTIVSCVMVLYEIKRDLDEHPYHNQIFSVLLGTFLIWWVIQLALNVVRINSQWAGWPFTYYKQTIGKDYVITSQGNQVGAKEDVIKPYTWKEVFNRQFGHYNPLLEETKNRKDDEGIWLAGTYAQYFLENQHNIIYDGMVGSLRQHMSDGDMCASYLRLKDKKTKYIVLDPNIATVVMGEGNKSLFYRFFMQQDANGNIIDDGVMSMITRMIMNGYMNVDYTNNLWIKYAYKLDSASVQNIMDQVGIPNEVVLRTMLGGARFFRDRADQLGGVILSIFAQRVPNGQAVEDLADVYGKIIDAKKVFTAVQLQASQNAQFKDQFDQLTEDEKFIFLQYANLLKMYQVDKTRFQQEITNIVQRSLWGWSQIMVFSLNEKSN